MTQSTPPKEKWGVGSFSNQTRVDCWGQRFRGYPTSMWTDFRCYDLWKHQPPPILRMIHMSTLLKLTHMDKVVKINYRVWIGLPILVKHTAQDLKLEPKFGKGFF